MTNTFNPGDIIISDLDGNEYEVVDFDSRNHLEPLPGVNLLGNALLVCNSEGKNKHLLYEWEVTKKE
jgi:hypothetical protein